MLNVFFIQFFAEPGAQLTAAHLHEGGQGCWEREWRNMMKKSIALGQQILRKVDDLHEEQVRLEVQLAEKEKQLANVEEEQDG